MACNAAPLQSVSRCAVARAGSAAALGRRPFHGGCTRLVAARPQRRRDVYVTRTQAFQAQWPDPDFINETKEAFPEKGVATVEEARVCHPGALFRVAGHAYHQ